MEPVYNIVFGSCQGLRRPSLSVALENMPACVDLFLVPELCMHGSLQGAKKHF